MKRIQIKNKLGEITHQAEMDTPTAWISDQVSGNTWGLPIRWVDDADCSDQDKAGALSTRVIEVAPAIPEQNLPAVTKTQYQLPATYTIEITDIQSEVDAEVTRKTQIQALRQRIKALANQADMTAADVKEAIMKYLKLKLLNKDLD
jgi:hypothetical protein